jgi:hypothetical protein
MRKMSAPSGPDIGALTQSNEDLAATIRQEGMYRRQDQRRFWIMMRVLSGLVALNLLLIAVVLSVGLVNREGVTRVKSCTTPGGSCYQENARRSSDAVGSVNLVTVAAVACAQEVRGDAAIKACVAARLPKAGR